MNSSHPLVPPFGKLLKSAALAGLFLSGAVAHALIVPGDILYSTNFTGANGTSPANWATTTGGTNTMTIESNRYRFNRPSGGSGTAMFGRYMGEFNGVDSADWTDYRVDTLIRSNVLTNTLARNAIILRWQTTSGPLNDNLGYAGYVFAVDATTIGLQIVRGFNNAGSSGVSGIASGTLLKSEQFSFALANDTDYRLSFEAAGSQLTLSFANLANTTSFSTSVIDTTYASGAPGLRTYQGSDSRRTDWDDYTVTAVIPEPGTLLLMGGAMGIFALMHGFRRKR